LPRLRVGMAVGREAGFFGWDVFFRAVENGFALCDSVLDSSGGSSRVRAPALLGVKDRRMQSRRLTQPFPCVP
jgi:hypothetical protein